ncbi:hypothetical protein HDV00_006376 [Rhizophlyctis rosea]|nr:hypothetical protein HDV00_006376 [Rhizophlyctis rosea]
MKAALLTTVIALAPSVLAFGGNCPARKAALVRDAEIFASAPKVNITLHARSTPPAYYKVAFVGDHGLGTNPTGVFNMIKNWGAQALVSLGDYDYTDNPSAFDTLITNTLGANFPYFAVIGNHDLAKWYIAGGYRDKMVARLAAFGGTSSCTGEYGVNMVCNWNGLTIVLSGVGVTGTNHATYITNAFAANTQNTWKICAWHKNQRYMQIGGKTDETGWAVYDSCRAVGAIVATGHEHSYSRTHLMSNFASQTIYSTSNNLVVTPGRTFAFVSGLGGNSIRSWDSTLAAKPWWAAKAASNNGVKYGALLCTFNINGNPKAASCTWKDTTGKVFDTFSITSTHSYVAKRDIPTKLAPSNPDFVEIPLAKASDAATYDPTTPETICAPSRLTFPNEKQNQLEHRLRFDISGVLRPGDKILEARLQIMGAAATPLLSKALGSAKIAFDTVDAIPLSLTIAGSLDQSSSPCSAVSRRSQTTKAVIPWTVMEDEEGFEGHEVWVSPDIKEVVEEVIKKAPAGKVQGVTLVVKGTTLDAKDGELKALQEKYDELLTRAAYGVHEESGLCVAPTLTLNIQRAKAD